MKEVPRARSIICKREHLRECIQARAPEKSKWAFKLRGDEKAQRGRENVPPPLSYYRSLWAPFMLNRGAARR